MKISKHVHSCLLVEEHNKTILLDPGNYSYDSHALDISRLIQLDVIGITHEHQDHMHLPFIKEIVAKFPNVEIITTESVVQILAKENIAASANGNDFVRLQSVPHEKIWMGNPVENVMITLFEKLASPGDSFAIDSSPEILALPLQGPWGSMMQAVDTTLRVKPKVVIPIHDFHLKDEFRQQYYLRLKDYFSQYNIDFKPVETGDIIEV